MPLSARSVPPFALGLGLLCLASSALAQDDALPPWAASTDAPPPDCFSPPAPSRPDGRPAPTRDAVRGLRELEAESARLGERARRYDEELRALLDRDHRRTVRRLDVDYGRRIGDELALVTEARDRAIVLFERFVARHPDDREHTPDAMFRLGQLYYERAIERFEGSSDDAPDLAPVVALYRDLLASFPAYRARAGALYLLGYALGETGELEEAVRIWQTLVCGAPLPIEAPATVDPAAAREHPALTLEPSPAEIASTGADPYAACTPIEGAGELASEIWLRIGEHHFDFDGAPGFLDRAISAYRRALGAEDDRTVDLALYKIAWSYYRASRYPEAIEHFARLVERADTGGESAAGSLRPEAIRYLALTFAYDDWDEDGAPDTRDDPTANGLSRLLEGGLVSRDAPFFREVLSTLGDVYLEEARYPLAVGAWEEVLRRFPLAPEAPDVLLQIARAERLESGGPAGDRREDELAERFGPGSAWAEANPEGALRIEEIVRDATLGRAIRHHQRATALRASGRVEDATTEYGIAAAAYESFLVAHPSAPEAYDVAWNRAEALFWSERYEEAAIAYASVRDSTYDDRYLGEAAARVVASRERALARSGLVVPIAAPVPENGAVARAPIPDAVAELARAREIYLARVSPARDEGHRLGAYALEQALTLERYGYWDDARDRLWAIYLERCGGDHAGADGDAAWNELADMAIALHDEAESERLNGDLGVRACTFGAASPPACVPDSRDSWCRRISIDASLDMQRGEAAYHDAEARAAAGDPTARGLFEQAASTLLDAVSASPDHADAPRALLLAGRALERSDHDAAAARVYQRVVEEVGPIVAADEERAAELDALVAMAYLGVAGASERAVEYEDAVGAYGAVAESSRFRRSAHPDVPGMIEEAVVRGAHLLVALERYDEAEAYYRRAAELLDGDEARAAAFLAADMAYRREDWADVVTGMERYLDAYGDDRSGVTEAVTAAFRIAEAREAEGASERARRTALTAVVERYASLGGTAGSDAAEPAAHAAYLLAEPEMDAIDRFTIDPGRMPTLDRYVDALGEAVTDGARRARAASDAYGRVLPYGRAVWTTRALARQGHAWERLALSTLEAPFEMPADLDRRIAPLDPDEREAFRIEIEDRVRQSLEPWTRAFECVAVSRYLLAVRLSREASLDDPGTREALDRLGRYGEERIAECVELVRTGDPDHGVTADPDLASYVPGELSRAPSGLTDAPSIGATGLGPTLAE